MSLSSLWHAIKLGARLRYDLIRDAYRLQLREEQRQRIISKAHELSRLADAHDMVLTVERKPRQPLAMRHHSAEVVCRDRLIRPTDFPRGGGTLI